MSLGALPKDSIYMHRKMGGSTVSWHKKRKLAGGGLNLDLLVCCMEKETLLGGSQTTKLEN